MKKKTMPALEHQSIEFGNLTLMVRYTVDGYVYLIGAIVVKSIDINSLHICTDNTVYMQ